MSANEDGSSGQSQGPSIAADQDDQADDDRDALHSSANSDTESHSSKEMMERERPTLKKKQTTFDFSKAESEKNTKYFLNLKHRRASNDTIKQIRTEQGIVVKDPNDIFLEMRRYYEKLYTKDMSINNVGNKLDNFLVK